MPWLAITKLEIISKSIIEVSINIVGVSKSQWNNYSAYSKSFSLITKITSNFTLKHLFHQTSKVHRASQAFDLFVTLMNALYAKNVASGMIRTIREIGTGRNIGDE